MTDAYDYFTSLLGGVKSAPQKKQVTIVTPQNVAEIKAKEANAEAEGVQLALEEVVAEKLAAEARASDQETEIAGLRQQLEELSRTHFAEIAALEQAKNTALSALENLQADLSNKIAAEKDKCQNELVSLMGELASLRKELAEKTNRIREFELERKNRIANAPVKIETVGQKQIAFTLRPLETLSERFAGEIREYILEVLCEALHDCRSKNKARREVILESVVAANERTCELERRRNELGTILKENANLEDQSVLEQLEAIGLKIVNGKDHWLVNYAGFWTKLAKDSSLNVAEVLSECFF